MVTNARSGFDLDADPLREMVSDGIFAHALRNGILHLSAIRSRSKIVPADSVMEHKRCSLRRCFVDDDQCRHGFFYAHAKTAWLSAGTCDRVGQERLRRKRRLLF